MSLQLSVVGIALCVESFELFDSLCGLLKPCYIMFCPLSDSGGEPEGYGVNGGIEGWIEGEDCLG